MQLQSALQEVCQQYGFEQTYWVAYSGGLDSHVLLHALASLRTEYPLKIRAVYINHGLSQHAEQWGQHCAQVCADLQIDFSQHKVNAKAQSGQSPEEIARLRRYEIFSNILAPNDYLLTAHHQDDQAETLLLQMMRGSGLKGLAAMPREKPLGQGRLLRPLLDFTREQLQQYAEQQNLKWINDESNENTDFSRNFMRHEVLPILKNRWPSVANVLARVAENCADAQELIDRVAEQDLQTVVGKAPNTISVTALLKLDANRQRYVIRAWLANLNFTMPPAVKLEQIQTEVMTAREDKMPCVTWGDVEVRRFQDELYAMPAVIQHDINQVFSWDFVEPLQLNTGDILQASKTIGQGIRADINAVTIRFRQGGETVRLPGRNCTHTLKNLFQEWGIPTWLRDRIPLVYVGDKIAAVVGYFVSEEYLAMDGEAGVSVVLQRDFVIPAP